MLFDSQCAIFKSPPGKQLSLCWCEWAFAGLASAFLCKYYQTALVKIMVRVWYHAIFFPSSITWLCASIIVVVSLFCMNVSAPKGTMHVIEEALASDNLGLNVHSIAYS